MKLIDSSFLSLFVIFSARSFSFVIVLAFMVFSLSPCSELNAGTLSENSIEDGTELRLVPAIESGVTVSVQLSVCLSVCLSMYVYITKSEAFIHRTEKCDTFLGGLGAESF